MLYCYSFSFSVTPNMLQSQECTGHIFQAYDEMGPINPFNVPRGICVNESGLDPSWIPR